ncbi:MAG: S46 family peptidase, partial [Flavobacteriales bacterium]|nr:S46 family peptidase [Flavobacteriales bacterium]
MKNKFLFLVLTCLCAFQLSAKEGMWIPTLLAAVEDDMKAYGCELSAEDIYSINQSSLKDAIVQFNGGCTAEVISKEGLLLTNHHCGYSQIQSHSSVENDYLKNGFWAYSKDKELSNPGVYVTFIQEMRDVTQDLIAIANNPEKFDAKKQERKMERKLRDQYLDNIERMLTDLSAKNLDLAIEIASIPDSIRGYGHVKE